MKIGDKVRMIRGTEEGRVIRVINDKLVEIDIEDGFSMPALKSDLVVVAQEEAQHFDKPDSITSTTTQTQESVEGIYAAFEVDEGKNKADLYFINNTIDTLLLTVHELDNQKKHQVVLSEKCTPSNSLKVGNYSINQFEDWPSFSFHLIRLKNKSTTEPIFEKYNFTPKAKSFFNQKTSSPLRNYPAYVIHLDDKKQAINIDDLTEKLFETTAQKTPKQHPGGSVEIDLHIEKLREDFEFLPKGEILSIQLSSFEKELDKALAKNYSEITFIHGVGSGKLKHEISKILSKHPAVKYYKDANKGKFGYGATMASFE